MSKNRVTAVITLILLTSACTIIFARTNSSAGLEAKAAELPLDPDEPIAFIGHGAMFDLQGNEIAPSPQFLQEAQAYYLNKLSQLATPEQRAQSESKQTALLTNTNLNVRDQMIAKAALIDWLIDEVQLADAGELQGKNNFIRGKIRDLYPDAADYTADQESELSSLLDSQGLLRLPQSAAMSKLATEAYIDNCEKAGVPIPPAIGSGGWQSAGTVPLKNLFIQLEGQDRSHFPIAEIFVHKSSSPAGVCMALSRQGKNNIGYLGIICLGKNAVNFNQELSSHACFWDYQKDRKENPIKVGQNIPLSEFAGGDQLIAKAGGICSDCHSGHNPFVNHTPGLALDPNTYPTFTGHPGIGGWTFTDVQLFQPETWYTPLVRDGWPKNPGPSALIDGITSPGECTACHTANSNGFPTITKKHDRYCAVVLEETIYRETMDLTEGLDYSPHIRALLAACPQPLGPFAKESTLTVDDVSASKVKFTVKIKNSFETDANGVTIASSFNKLTLDPASVKFSRGNGTISGNSISWKGNIAKNAQLTIEYTARFDGGAPAGTTGSNTVSIDDGYTKIKLSKSAQKGEPPGNPDPPTPTPTITPTPPPTPTQVPPPPPGNRGFLPALEAVPGTGWKAGIQAQNGGKVAAPIGLTVFEPTGHSRACGSESTSPGQSANFLSYRECALPHPPLGSGVLHAKGQPLSSIVMINNSNPQGTGFAGASYTGMSEGVVAKTIFFPLIKHQHNGRTTVFSVQNASDKTNNITAVFRVNGSEFKKSYSNIPPLTSVLVTPADAGVPGGFGQVGSLTVTGTQPLAGSSLEHKQGAAVAENLQASTAFTPADFDDTLFCPLVRSGHTSKGLTSGVQVQNVSTVAQTVEYTYAPIGGGAKIKRTRSVSPGASATFYSPTEGVPKGSLGAVTLKGSEDIVAVVNERGSLADGRVIQTTYACFGKKSTSNEILIPLYKEFYKGNTTGIQVQNVSGTGHVATIELEYQVSGPGGSSGQATFSHKTPVADGASITFWGVSILQDSSDIFNTSGNPDALQGTYGSVVIKSDQPVVAIVNESTYAFNGKGSNQDSKNYEGFNVGERSSPPPPPPPPPGSPPTLTPTPTATPPTSPPAKAWRELGSNSASQGGLSDNAGDSLFPSVAADHLGQPYVVWTDNSSGNEEIYLLYWDKNKNQWRELGGSASGGGVSKTPKGESLRPAITEDNGNIYVSWEDDSSGKWQIYVRRWDPASGKWKNLGPTTGGGASNRDNRAWFSSIKILSGTPYLAFRGRDASSGGYEIYVKKYDKNKNSWVGMGGSASGGGISNTSGDSRKPSIVQVPNGDVYVSWHDKEDGDFDVYVKKWDGSKWSSATNISKNSSVSNYSMMVADSDGKLYVSWDDDKSGNREIYMKIYSGGQWKELGGSASGGGISKNGGSSRLAAIAVDKTGRPHILWMDDSNGDYEIYAKQWDGSSWKEIGSGSASGGGISKNDTPSERPWLAISPDGVPYATWADGPEGKQEIYFKQYK